MVSTVSTGEKYLTRCLYKYILCLVALILMFQSNSFPLLLLKQCLFSQTLLLIPYGSYLNTNIIHQVHFQNKYPGVSLSDLVIFSVIMI